MKLKVTDEAIRELIKPQRFNPSDIVSITPELTIGHFHGAAINIVQGYTIVVTESIALAYRNLQDFLAGSEPISLISDTDIYYDQGDYASSITIEIVHSVNDHINADPDFKSVRELMFGAREYSDAEHVS